MKKFLRAFLRKRAQGAFVVVLVWLLQQFGIVVPDTVYNSIMILVQALGAIWGIYGVVDAFPGHNGKEPA